MYYNVYSIILQNIENHCYSIACRMMLISFHYAYKHVQFMQYKEISYNTVTSVILQTIIIIAGV